MLEGEGERGVRVLPHVPCQNALVECVSIASHAHAFYSPTEGRIKKKDL